jgi:hypothetical protein
VREVTSAAWKPAPAGVQRFQLNLNAEVYSELRRLAEERGTSVTEIIRQFIDLGFVALEVEQDPDADLAIRRKSGEVEVLRLLLRRPAPATTSTIGSPASREKLRRRPIAGERPPPLSREVRESRRDMDPIDRLWNDPSPASPPPAYLDTVRLPRT